MSQKLSGNAQILALTSMITQAVQDVITEYAAIGREVPSLDSVETSPFDIPEETPAKLANAVQIIEAACAQLSHTISTPGHVVVNKALEHEEPASLLVVTEHKIADLLLNKPEGVPATELAAKTGLDAGKLTRILRLLATKHCFREVKPGVFANNRISMKLLSSDPVSSIVSLLTDESLLASAHLNETMTVADPKDNGIPFQRATGYPFFDYYKTPQGLAKGQRFPRAMVGWGNVTGKGLMTTVYPWASQNKDATVCDVAGGNGHVTMGLMKAHSHLKVVLQDQPQVLDQAREFWNKEHPDAITGQRIQFVPFNFFKDAAVEGCDFYYVRSVILRDWPDAESITILSNVRKAMKTSSRLIIHDTVLRDAVRGSDSDSDFTLAPEPLLPNWGVARVRTYGLDMTMMNLLNSQARTLPEFIELCGKCGLKFEKLYEAGETDLVEFSPV
ncbi:S-adenosyl-L-methionine-dependent methyltransferase [Dendrothele bispora CBS 962.96]|uniref:S-adenosyl-L-methionine-dependent methyltransferase n=1 Tax=Dendrothele bispora (strain CBS 962.96) TaxID=1314807 RepID=A0A4S8LAS5_DENBC|nr:S-adenosyl-L-methionine-dependent methyltransferase [Dendrothele bispora CBS 962.96]